MVFFDIIAAAAIRPTLALAKPYRPNSARALSKRRAGRRSVESVSSIIVRYADLDEKRTMETNGFPYRFRLPTLQARSKPMGHRDNLPGATATPLQFGRSEEHTSELQSR